MMKNMKRLLALLLAGVMLVGMAACGSEDTVSDDDEGDAVVDKNDGVSEEIKGETTKGEETNGDEENPVTESKGLVFELTETGDSYRLTGIGDCTDTVVVIPATYEGKPVTEIGYEAFADNSTVTRVIIPKGVTNIDTYAFYRSTALESVVIPDGVTNINACAFSGCTSLASVELPDSVETIGHLAFASCESLTSIDLPDQVTSLSATFEGCSALKDVTLPANLTDIGERVFNNCHALESIDIPETVTAIHYEAFIRCESLKEVNFSDKFDGWKAEYDYEMYELSDAAAMAALLSDNNGWGVYELQYTDDAGLLYEVTEFRDQYCLDFVRAEDKTITNAVIASEISGFPVLVISQLAFEDCTELVSVTIPASAVFVDSLVLYGCDKVESVIFEETTGWTESDETVDVSDPAQNVKTLKSMRSSDFLSHD